MLDRKKPEDELKRKRVEHAKKAIKLITRLANLRFDKRVKVSTRLEQLRIFSEEIHNAKQCFKNLKTYSVIKALEEILATTEKRYDACWIDVVKDIEND